MKSEETYHRVLAASPPPAIAGGGGKLPSIEEPFRDGAPSGMPPLLGCPVNEDMTANC